MTGPAAGTHPVTRLSFDTGQPYEDFRRRYEEAVPPISREQIAAYAGGDTSWDDVVADADRLAPHGFLIYWRSDFVPLMGLAGDTARCTAYLMGNHTIAERMYRHDPAVMLYAPLRTLISADDRGTAWFALDQPSSLFGSFGVPEIARVGAELDSKVVALLTDLDVSTAPLTKRTLT
jgi:uncharacterized protein (DUF302 family)